MMRDETRQLECEPITDLMTQTWAGAGELYHALEGCSTLKVEVVLGPLQRELGAFQLALQRAITDFAHPDATRAAIAPGLHAAAAQLEAAASATEKEGRADQRLVASVQDARRLVRALREELAGPEGTPTTPSLAGGGGSGGGGGGGGGGVVDDGDVDVRGTTGQNFAVRDFWQGMRVEDQVLGLGRVLEVGAAGTPHAGDVRIDYDDHSAAHGVPEPLWRPVTEGLIIPVVEGETDGIRVTGDDVHAQQ